MSIKLKIKKRDGQSPASALSEEASPLSAVGPKIKLKTSGIKAKSLASPLLVPKIKVKAQRVHGLGYDSEAEDREMDPYIEEEFILRMPPGEDCEYLRKAIEDRTIGVSADVFIKFKDSRRAIVSIQKHLYAAMLMDLPCIVESNKTIDRKTIYKAADICQILVVGTRIENEDDLSLAPLKHSEHNYPHGITPPLYEVRRRRFRKRVSHQKIETVENEVNRLMEADEEAESTSFEILENASYLREGSHAYSDIDSPFDMLGGRYHQFGERNEDDDDLLAGQIEQSMMEVDEDNKKRIDLMAHDGRATGSASEESESDEEDSADEVGDSAMRERQAEITKLREDITDLNNSITQLEMRASTAINKIISRRINEQKEKVEAERDLKAEQLEDLLEQSTITQ